MLDSSVSSIVNQCVSCQSTFTAAEKPLKLLPCLHSMCLDCLYGRIPTPAPTTANNTNSEKTADSASKQDTSESNHEDAKTKEGLDSNSESTQDEKEPENNEKLIQDDDKTTTEETAENGIEESETAPSKDDAEKIDTDNSKAVSEGEEESRKSTDDVNSEEGVQPEKPVEGDKPVSPSANNCSSPPVATDGVDGNEDAKSDPLNSAKPAEVKDVNPEPVKECPVCRDTIIQAPALLMDNMFATLDQKQSVSSNVNTSHLCTACEEGQQANSYCVQCEEWLCDSCVDAHKRVRVTKDHVISPKDQVSSTTSKSPWEQQMMCKQHRQEQLKFFCEKCETMTCRDCQLMDHKEHKYQFLDQAAEQYKARLKGSLALMGEKRTKLATSRDEIEQKLLNCKEQKDTVQTDILRQADILVKRIRTSVWGVLSNLASFTDAATKRLNKEIEDVSDLIGKFDHCVQFMEDILKNGTSMSLLYSKGNVEAKCRKVYHTQVDPQSLKGNLMIQYKHDVNWLLGNLNKIGSIFVNGVRYPPEKPPGSSGGGGSSGQNNTLKYHNTTPASYQQAGLSTNTSPHLQHMANQTVPGQRGGGTGGVGDEWSKFIQTVSTKPAVVHQLSQSAGPPNMSLAGMAPGNNSLPPQLTLPSRRSSNTSMGHTWSGMPGSNFPGHFSQGPVMSQQQQPHMGQPSRPMFTPMRLHHRPAAHGFSGQNDTHKGNMRSPPTSYRMGGEASGSNASGNSSRSNHGTPDPARPASAGMYDGNSRPDSAGSGPAMIDIKKERRDQSPDCIITSTSLRNEKQNMFQTSPLSTRVSETVLEMQKNLDDVIRAVPMDLSENLEQISGSRPLSEDTAHLGNRQKFVASPLSNLSSSLTTTAEEMKSPTDEELRENWQGGNSMPGFSIPSNLQVDPNDDYCACCHNGGDVLCCDKCPRVFHLQCHIPEIPSVPSGSFMCTICEGDQSVEHEEFNAMGKRSTALSEYDIKVCKRILLDLFCHPSSIPFHEPVSQEQVPNYYKIITQPKDFTQIKMRLERKHPNHYQSIKGFLYDLRQVFINCHIYNKKTSEVGKAGLMVRERFESLVSRLMAQYLEFVKENPTPCFSALLRQGDPDLADGEIVEGGDPVNNGDVSNKRPLMGGDEMGSAKRMKTGDGVEGC